ncbi:MAG: hypothetical protein WC989_01675 [Micavibrio sp.]
MSDPNRPDKDDEDDKRTDISPGGSAAPFAGGTDSSAFPPDEETEFDMDPEIYMYMDEDVVLEWEDAPMEKIQTPLPPEDPGHTPMGADTGVAPIQTKPEEPEPPAGAPPPSHQPPSHTIPPVAPPEAPLEAALLAEEAPPAPAPPPRNDGASAPLEAADSRPETAGHASAAAQDPQTERTGEALGAEAPFESVSSPDSPQKTGKKFSGARPAFPRLSGMGALISPRKAFYGLLILAPLLLACFAFLQLPEIARAKMEDKLRGAGYPQARIHEISISSSAIEAHDIKLDQFGFDEIKLLHADLSWPSFLLHGTLKGMSLSGIHIGRDSTNLAPGFKKLMQSLLTLPDYRITLGGVTLDVTTDVGELRLTMDASVDTGGTDSVRTIRASIHSEQYQLGFKSDWTGTLDKNGNLDLAAELVDGRLNMGPLRISRFNGWIGANLTDGRHSIETQLEAGSANLMNVPLHNLSLIASHNDGSNNVIVRSGLSGMPDVLFTADYLKPGDTASFQSVLSGQNLGMLLDYIEEATGHQKVIRDALVNAGMFRMTLDFDAAKRFVGGPLPFVIALQMNGEPSLSGNALLYPDTFDLRGSLETSEELATALQNYFKIPPSMMRQNYIRLDGNIRSLFYSEEGQPPPPGTVGFLPAE